MIPSSVAEEFQDSLLTEESYDRPLPTLGPNM